MQSFYRDGDDYRAQKKARTERAIFRFNLHSKEAAEMAYHARKAMEEGNIETAVYFQEEAATCAAFAFSWRDRAAAELAA